MSPGWTIVLALGSLSVTGLLLVAYGLWHALGQRPEAAPAEVEEEPLEVLRELHVVLRGIRHAEMIRVLQANPGYRAQILRTYATPDDPWRPSAELLDVHLQRDPHEGELQQVPSDEVPPGH